MTDIELDLGAPGMMVTMPELQRPGDLPRPKRAMQPLKEYTARSFADEFRISSVTARRYLNRLVKEGKAKSEQKPLRINLHGKEVETRKTVTTYTVK